MRNQSEASLTTLAPEVGNLNLRPLGDLLAGDDLALLDVCDVEDIPVELYFDPTADLPYQVRVNTETEEAYAELADARQAFEFLRVEVRENLNARKRGEYCK